MAKRLTDTEKWKRDWFRKLDARLKLFWLYLCDDCDHAAIWIEDFQTASIQVGYPVSAIDYDSFGGRIVRLSEDKVFIPRFIEFQYGVLRESSPLHQKVIRELRKRGVDPVTLTLSARPLLPCNNHPVLDPAHRVPGTLEREEEREREREREEEKEEGSVRGDSTPPPGWETATTLQRSIANLKAAGQDTSSLESWMLRMGAAHA